MTDQIIIYYSNVQKRQGLEHWEGVMLSDIDFNWEERVINMFAVN